MPSHHIKIRCLGCGYEPPGAVESCPRCGGATAKICGKCGFANAVPKNFCDGCGEPVGTNAAWRPGTPPLNARRRTNHSRMTARNTAWRAARQTAKLTRKFNDTIDGFKSKHPVSWKIILLVILLSAAAGLAVVAAYVFVAPRIPDYKLLSAAKQYLRDMSAGDYRKAYALLSRPSREVCTQEEFETVSRAENKNVWEFADLSVTRLNNDYALVRYHKREGGGPWSGDYIPLVSEDGGWARPYIQNMFPRVDDALAKNDASAALMWAQRMNLIDPLDPRARGYLCRAQYAMKRYKEAAAACAEMLDSLPAYPATFSAQALLNFRYTLAESYRNTGLGSDALLEYAAVLSQPDAPADIRCGARLSRARIYVGTRNYEAALQETLAAQSDCRTPQSKDEAALYLRVLNGSAQDAAVQLAKNFRRSPSEPPLSQVWKEKQTRSYKTLKLRKYPENKWLGIHLSGPFYRVVVRQEGGRDRANRPLAPLDLARFRVDAWLGTASPENPQ
ncbi:MAG: hypothetical protein PHP45_09090 [Elusimicrobiales bacterium]|nr:hypothetical protein [Elusimicrobiales bacterium]